MRGDKSGSPKLQQQTRQRGRRAAKQVAENEARQEQGLPPIPDKKGLPKAAAKRALERAVSVTAQVMEELINIALMEVDQTDSKLLGEKRRACLDVLSFTTAKIPQVTKHEVEHSVSDKLLEAHKQIQQLNSVQIIDAEVIKIEHQKSTEH